MDTANPCKHAAFESGPGIDGVRCLDCKAKIADGSVWCGIRFIAEHQEKIIEEAFRGW